MREQRAWRGKDKRAIRLMQEQLVSRMRPVDRRKAVEIDYAPETVPHVVFLDAYRRRKGRKR